MQVRAYIYAPPGRGEGFCKELTMPDTAAPRNPAEAVARSLNAIKHFWPRASGLCPATHVRTEADQIVVVGEWTKRNPDCPTQGPLEWEVIWRTDARVAADARLLSDLANGDPVAILTGVAQRRSTATHNVKAPA